MAEPRPVDPSEVRRQLDRVLPSLAVRVSETERDLADLGEYPDTEQGRRRLVNRIRRTQR